MTPSVMTRVRHRPGGVAAAPVDQAPVEDEADLVGAPGVEVVADDLFEEQTPGYWGFEQTRGVLQLRHVDVAIHPIDALHLERHMIIEDIADAARYRHHRLRSDGRPADQPTATGGSYTGPARRSRSKPRPAGAPHQPKHRHTTRRAGAKPR